MVTIETSQGKIIVNDSCPSTMIDCALSALMNPTPRSFKSSMLCNQYDDEGWTDCKLALSGELIASPEELVIAQEILNKRLSIEKAQALLH